MGQIHVPHVCAQAFSDLENELGVFRPPLGLPRINILLFGGVGAGKSSLVSSVYSLLNGRISRRAGHGQGTGSFTRMLQQFCFKILKETGGPDCHASWK